jgi:hypothetical protein
MENKLPSQENIQIQDSGLANNIMSHYEADLDDVILLEKLSVNLNAFFTVSLEYLFPLPEVFDQRPEDAKKLVNLFFRGLMKSGAYKFIFGFNDTYDNPDIRQLPRLISQRYCHFRDFDSQEAYSRYLLSYLENLTWRTDLAVKLYSTIETAGFYHLLDKDFLEQQGHEIEGEYEIKRADELVIEQINLAMDSITGTIHSYAEIFTPKIFEKWQKSSTHPKNSQLASYEKLIKSERFTLKQQLIILDKLGLKNMPIWAGIGNEKKARILSQLLNRNEQDIRAMLTYWGLSKGVEERYNTTKAEDIKKVDNFLKVNLG